MSFVFLFRKPREKINETRPLTEKSKRKNDSWIFHEAIHANVYFMEIDRLEQEEFERGGGPLDAWPPYVTGPRQWATMSATFARATARETAVKLVRLALANAAVRSSSLSSLADDSLLSRRKRSAFKLLKDASKSAARKRDLATAAADSLLLESRYPSSSVLERWGARAAAKWRRGPALAAAAGATAFRSGFLFAAADFVVSVATETAKALWEAAKEKEEEGRDAARRRGESSPPSLRGRAAALCRSVSGVASSSLASASSADALRSLTTALVYALAVPSIFASSKGSGDVLVADASPSASFLPVAGVAAAALALAAAGASLRSALGDDRADALKKSVSRSAVRVAAGLSATSAAYGLAVACPWLPSWTWPAVQLASDNAAHVLLVGPAVSEQAETGRVGGARAGLLSAALAAAAVAAVGVL